MVKKYIEEYVSGLRKVLAVVRKPDRDELKTITKLTVILVSIIGVYGFIFYLIGSMLIMSGVTMSFESGLAALIGIVATLVGVWVLFKRV